MLMAPGPFNTTFLPALQFGEAAEALAACEDDDDLVLGNKVGCSADVDIDSAVLTNSALALESLESVTRCELGLGLGLGFMCCSTSVLATMVWFSPLLALQRGAIRMTCTAASLARCYACSRLLFSPTQPALLPCSLVGRQRASTHAKMRAAWRMATRWDVECRHDTELEACNAAH